MISSRSIDDLHPRVALMARQFIANCKMQLGVDILIYSTYRDKESQNALYAQGRTMPGRIVTNARGGESLHNYRCAFDFVPLVHGKPAWDDADLYKKCAEIGEWMGFEWAGRWVSFKETCHLQWTNGRTLAQFKAGVALV